MKKLVRNAIIAVLFGSAFLSVGFSPIWFNDSIPKNTDVALKIQLSQDTNHEKERAEFWRKFRESVTPPKENPPSPPRHNSQPKEVHPKEIHPKEVKPKEA